jgi:hypothetical protein
MNTNDLGRSLPALFSELIHGSGERAYVLNPHDPGLLAALDRLAADEASSSRDGGATIAAHAEHLAFGISLLNRWASGEPNPFADADWSAAWRRTTVDENEWADVRRRLRDEVERWHTALGTQREIGGADLDGVVASVIHLAYHLGAIRQISAGARGPKDGAS